MSPEPVETLRGLLDEYDGAALIALATFHGVLPEGNKSKKAIAGALARKLARPQVIRATLARLSPVELAAVNAILRHGGRSPLTSLHAELLEEGHVEQARSRRERYGPAVPDWRLENSRYLDDILARLTFQGLVFAPRIRSHARDTGRPRRLEDPLTVAIIPPEIREHLPAPASPPLPEPVLAPPRIAESSARALQRDLYLYWSYVRDHPSAITVKGEIHKRALTDVNATLLMREAIGKGESESQHPRLRFLRGLLTGLGALVEYDGREVAAAPAPEFFARAPAERVRTAYEAWRTEDFFSEFLLLPPEAQPDPRSGMPLIPAAPAVVHARDAVVAYVEDLPPDGWVSLEALIARMRREDYEFLFAREAWSHRYRDFSPAFAMMPNHPYEAWTNPLGLSFPGARDDAGGWNVVEANFIRAVVTGPLHWLGLVDLGWADAEAGLPTAYCLTALGRWLLAGGECPAIPAEGGRVIVQPNLHIVALDPVADATLVVLDRFAERLSAERAVEYRLTRAAVYAGQQAGWDVARIKAYLEEQTGAPLPANVARTLDEWQAQHERIVLRSHVALAHGTPEWLDALAGDEATAPLLAGRPLPEVAVLRDAHALEPLTSALHARGVLPLVTREPIVSAGSVIATELGALEIAVRAPSLYLHGHLAAFADPAPQGGYQLTPESVGRAARNGLTAAGILERLQAVHRGPLPAGLDRRVRAWAKHYGDAALQAVTLLELRDEEVLAELLADPEVGPLLKRFRPPQGRALARVRPADAERLKQLLAERGIDVEGKIG